MAFDVTSIPTIEATSLSSLLDLASNPPSQPQRSEPGTAPLVLYIARVPGSRDVFLTPIKPRDKIVTASDVQSSLYYLHWNGYQYNESTPRPSTVEPSTNNLPLISNSKSLKRKAVPLPKALPLPPLPPLPRRPVPPASPPYPVDENERPNLPARPDTLTYSLSRKPVLPARSIQRHQLKVDIPALPPRPLPPTPPLECLELEISSFERDDLGPESYANTPDVVSVPNSLKRQEEELESRPEPGTLTVIRRNPGSGEQWNVAAIADPSVSEINSSSIAMSTTNAKRQITKQGAPMYLDIMNPGYAQFLKRNESEVSISTTSSSGETDPAPLTSQSVFSRRLYLPGSNYSAYSQSHHKHSSIGSLPVHTESRIPQNPREGRFSVDFSSRTPQLGKRSKGYTFLSPWSGRCEFQPSTRGTSLRCRHFISDSSIHPSFQESGIEVSELRFNLPSSALASVSSAKSTSSPLLGYFSGREHLLPHPDDDEEGQSPTMILREDGRIDLTLGQERAGGGFGGKQAKLGKLIIHPAGFEMLDLLVAANLGLWWRVWDRHG